ncbi:hypothetical protein [Segniliparus rugosus]|uniref:Uncharacterized protein n=1 Tax=Segniliparus rugosus (strain ATCC BAA-974 / DSM 45345 / CCUG 50838 / CIP 108380 / JCM 13579 / CDC 945) TaxID=679197 RepID=E5XVE0_SEGRC|nr:hypothetical protein [Segniliparus rugosus]EFV11680.2 hypothetical protein HMPREF9336_03462 [Segniliparus rugosus ATCC BAA-974]
MPDQTIAPFWRPSFGQRFGDFAYKAFYYTLAALFVAMVGARAADLPFAGTLTWVAILSFLGGAAIFIAIALTTIGRAERRRAKRVPFYQDFARRQGWDYRTDGAWLAEHFFSENMRADGVRPFRSAADPNATGFQTRDVFTGSWRGKPFAAFSYSPPSQRSGSDDD